MFVPVPDAAWWIPYDDRAGTLVPWTGEVVPPEAIPIEIPPSVPIAGPIIQFIGQGEHAIWNDVWGWVKGESKKAVDEAIQLDQTIIGAVANVVETYVGKELAALSGFINQGFDFTKAMADSLSGAVIGTWDFAQAGISYLDGAVYTILADVVGIDNIVIPGLEAELRQLGIDTWNLVGHGILGVETWAIDNIYTPLDAKIRAAELAIPVWAGGAYADAQAYADELVHSEALKRAAAIAGIAASVAAITAWIDDCGEPMCQQLGPKTDLGKLLKGLHLAADAALIAALLDMNEADLIRLIHAVTSRLASVVGDVEQFLGPGGETVAGLIAHATTDLI